VPSVGRRDPYGGRALTVDPVTAYAKAVAAGQVVAGPLVRLACARHLRDIKAWGTRRSGKAPYWFDRDAVQRVIAFFASELVLPDMTDEDGDVLPFTLQPWQAFIVGNLFGWKKADGHRRFRTGYIETGKGSGKTPLGAGIALYCLVADGQLYPEVYSAAVSQKQARITWVDAARMVTHSKGLQREVEPSAHRLTGKRRGGHFEAISSEYRGLEGKRPHCAIIDEVHEHPNAQVVTKMRRGTKRNKDALIVELTNSGYDKLSICYQHHEYSERVLQQVATNDGWFAYICGLDELDDWTDRACWPKANPNIGVTIDWSYLQEAVDEAKGMPAAEADVRRLNFCEWIEKQSTFIPAATWQAGARVMPPELSDIAPYGGLDIGMTDDLSAFSLVWRIDADTYYGRVWYWVPRATVQKHPTRPWSVWQQQGAITLTDGDVTDFARVRVDVSRMARQYGCASVAFDKRFAAQMAQELQGEGIEMIDQPQGYNLNEPTRKLEALLRAGQYWHDGDPVTTWQASNLVVTRGARGEIRPDKEKSGDKIDGIVASIMALGRAMLAIEEPPSVYETRGVLSLRPTGGA
jgi:phage terminase large subunit-like protein